METVTDLWEKSAGVRLGRRHVIAINTAVGIDIVAEVPAVRCLTGVTLHGRDVIAVDFYFQDHRALIFTLRRFSSRDGVPDCVRTAVTSAMFIIPSTVASSRRLAESST